MHSGRTSCEKRVSSSAVAYEATYARTMLVFRRATTSTMAIPTRQGRVLPCDLEVGAAQQRDARH